jgi:hypothetical protein
MSWIAELILEARNPTAEGQEPFEIPAFLLEQFSSGLFGSISASESRHPIEDLQRYAKQFTKLSFGPVSIKSKDDSQKNSK